MFDVTVLSECIEINTNKKSSTKGQIMPGIIFSSASVERRMPERRKKFSEHFHTGLHPGFQTLSEF